MRFLYIFTVLAVYFFFSSILKVTPLSQANVTKKLKDFCVSHMNTRYSTPSSSVWSCTQSIKRRNTRTNQQQQRPNRSDTAFVRRTSRAPTESTFIWRRTLSSSTNR